MAGFFDSAGREAAQQFAPELEEAKRRRGVELGLGFATIFSIEDDVRTELLLEPCFQVLAVLDGVDHAQFLGLLGGMRAAVDPGLDQLGADLAAGGDPFHLRVVEAVEQPVLHGLGLLAGALAQEDLGGALVIAAGHEIGFDSDLFEQAMKIRRLAIDARYPEVGRGDDAQVGRRREQEVLAQAADRVGVGNDVLTCRAKA